MKDFKYLLNLITDQVLNPLAWFFLALAVVYFLYGVFKYVRHADEEDARRAAKDMILYGVIGICVMLSVWGLVNLVKQTIKLDNDNIPQPRLFP